MITITQLSLSSLFLVLFSTIEINCFQIKPIFIKKSNINHSKYSKLSAVSVVERLKLNDNFRRWKYMQNLLDEELPAQDVNELLYTLLENYLQGDDDDADLATPERRDELLEVLTEVLDFQQEVEDRKILPVLKDPDCQPGDAALLDKLKELLPDPVENEDAHKGAWDTVKEIHGQTAVKYNESEGRAEWNAVCLVARIMTYFNYLTGDGLISSSDAN
mmetsp:Transcript_20595/g.31191  ORF Transcript_20595/g.31191 Transcript_20595/m.31191 type:complete len:218 (+) Transcript_20595:87-740(+)